MEERLEKTDPYVYRQRLHRLHSKRSERESAAADGDLRAETKLPGRVNTVLDWVFLTKETAYNKFMSRATVGSNFIARYATYMIEAERETERFKRTIRETLQKLNHLRYRTIL
ncbi:MAG: hypothetical protein LBT81_02645 [Helicobacteraceae bacterium]|nr:hypothetical protein [Helicobacteraceae bacterium]